MLGVVVWSKESTQAAVIWCEDHGAIAYLKGYDGLAEQPDYLSADPAPPRWPAVGDLVMLETVVVGGLRRAHNLSIVEADWGAALPISLIAAAPQGAGEDPAPAPWPPWRPDAPGSITPVSARQAPMPPCAVANPPAQGPDPASPLADPASPDAAGPASAGPALTWPRRGRG
ncbi:hypothetical protein [Frigidibacter mobilis]|uniref:hypothetical protein n=1 Tax=Frigidibacter mobilis TaxID=1335048 RepID=UPI00083391E4|nr:hypothetical protein [Frigidibacter mobilis]